MNKSVIQWDIKKGSIKYFIEVVMLELRGEGPGKFHQREEVGKGIAEGGKNMG